MKPLIFFLLIGISSVALGQTKTVKGRVVNADNQNAVEFANIGIVGTFFGTAGNADGFFELKIPAELQSYNITVSSMGYKPETFPVSQWLSQEFVRVSLKEQAFMIESVSVEAQSRVLHRVIRTAIQQIQHNYMAGPFTLQFYYLEQYSSGDSVVQTREGIVDLFDHTGYQNTSIIDAFQNRGYRFTQAKKDFSSWSFSSGQNGFDELLEMDLVRLENTIMNEGIISDYTLSLERIVPFQGDSTMVISYRTTKPGVAHSGDSYALSLEGKLYVLKSSYTVVRNECIINSEKNNWQNRALFTNQNFQNNVSYRYVSIYNKVNDKYVLNYVECNKSYINEKGEKLTYYRKANPVSFQPSVTGSTSRNYFEDSNYIENFWSSFERP